MSNQIIAIDLGSRSTKAICLQREGEALHLVNYTIQDRPNFGKPWSREQLAKHLEAVTEAVNPKAKNIVLAVSPADSVICHAEMPAIKTDQMRKMVKLNPKIYFQEDLPNHSFDCLVLHQGGDAKSEGKPARKAKTLIVAIKNQLLHTLVEGTATAGLKLEAVTASQTDAANALLFSEKAARDKIVALVDIGFSHSSISLLVNGEITLTRVVNIGADKFTSGLAEAMNITYSVAEGLKQIMPEKVNSQLKALVSPLCHELSNSIHFFEQQHDRKVSEVFVFGGSGRSNFILEILQTELNLPCKSWDPTSSLKVDLPPPQLATLRQEAPQLAVAIGAALSRFRSELPQIDLLAERKEEAEIRSRDPMKRGYAVAAILVALMLGWYAITLVKAKEADQELQNRTAQLNSMESKFMAADADEKQLAHVEQTLAELDAISTNRFLWGDALNALQHTVVDNFQMVRLQITQEISQTRAIPAVTNVNKQVIAGRPAETTEQTTFRIQARSFSKPSAAESFMGAIAASPWFKENLRPEQPCRLTESQAPVVDPLDPTKMTISFTVECYAEHKL